MFHMLLIYFLRIKKNCKATYMECSRSLCLIRNTLLICWVARWRSTQSILLACTALTRARNALECSVQWVWPPLSLSRSWPPTYIPKKVGCTRRFRVSVYGLRALESMSALMRRYIVSARSILHPTCTYGTFLHPTCTYGTCSYSSMTLAIRHIKSLCGLFSISRVPVGSFSIWCVPVRLAVTHPWRLQFIINLVLSPSMFHFYHGWHNGLIYGTWRLVCHFFVVVFLLLLGFNFLKKSDS
jgi:hypothetical protein